MLLTAWDSRARVPDALGRATGHTPDGRSGTAASAIAVTDIRKGFGGTLVLESVTFAVGRGEIVAIVGRNGAGKSTLLRIIGTLVLPDHGSVVVEGYDAVRDEDEVRRRIGLMLADERSWYWRLTGRHNLEFFAMLHGSGWREARRRADRLLGEVGLDAAADRPIGTYSSGMRLRLSLARALLGEPSVLVLDEPTRSLDPEAAARFRQLLDQLARRRSTAILMATHDLHEAAALATRTLGLSNGIVAFERARGVAPCELEEALIALAR